MTVSDLLTASRAAHLAYRQSAGRCDTKGNISHPYDGAKCEAAITTAQNTRLQAHQIDPKHTDPAWQLDLVAHDALVQFYASFLA